MSEQQPVDATKRRVMREIDQLSGRMVETLSELIKIPSVNPKYPGQVYGDHIGRERDANLLVAKLFREAGADVEMVVAEKGRDNAAGRVRGVGGGRSLVLNGHVDVVPPNQRDRWQHDPFSGQVTADRVHGRGATDDKGGVIAMSFAALALSQAGVRLEGDLILQSVVGEEMGDHLAGTSAVLDAGYMGDAAIVCEPSNFDESDPNLAPTTPGLLVWTIEIEGLATHAGLRGLTIHPTLDGQSLGVNAIDKYWVIYGALRQLEDEWAHSNRHPLFAPGYFGILPGVIQAGSHGVDIPFFLADRARIEYCSFHHPDRTNADVIAEVEATIARACAGDPWLRAHPPKVTWQLTWEPYTTPPDLPLVGCMKDAFRDIAGRDLLSAGMLGVCDLTWMKEVGMDGVVYGPGVGRTAHAIDEYVMIRQLEVAAKMYALSAINFCGLAT
jgi:acetylornithine deacetylase